MVVQARISCRGASRRSGAVGAKTVVRAIVTWNGLGAELQNEEMLVDLPKTGSDLRNGGDLAGPGGYGLFFGAGTYKAVFVDKFLIRRRCNTGTSRW
jgi:hypothetical protein